MKVLAIIPARMGSTRFPGKPLEKILGFPMVGHVYKRTLKAANLTDVYVATCDDEIRDFIHSIDGNVVMTASTHERCTDRTAEALLKIEKERGIKYDVVVMIQGDEPMVTPEMINASAGGLINDSSAYVVNLAAKIENENEFNDPNTIKVVMDQSDNAIYFSRAPIPSIAKSKNTEHRYKQVCVISFRREFLLEFMKLSETPLEVIESVDMMRVLEHAKKVKMVRHNEVSYAVDTKQDLAKVEKVMRNDKLLKEYLSH